MNKIIIVVIALFVGLTQAEYSAKIFIDGVKFNNEVTPPPPSGGSSFTISSLNLNASKVLNLNNQSTNSISFSLTDFSNFATPLSCAIFDFNSLMPYFDGTNITIPSNTNVQILSEWGSDYSGGCNAPLVLNYTENGENKTSTGSLTGSNTIPSVTFNISTSDLSTGYFDVKNETNSRFYGYGILKRYFIDGNGDRTLISSWPSNIGDRQVVTINSGATSNYSILGNPYTPDLDYGGSVPGGSTELFILEMHSESNANWTMTEYQFNR